MPNKKYSHDFIPSTGDSFWDVFFSDPMKVIRPREHEIESVYNHQMDNFGDMLQQGFENYPFETVVGQDTLTWLSPDSLVNLCEERNGLGGDYVACTFHNEPSLISFKDENFPKAGSHTYISSLLPESLWEDIGCHEKDHHAVTSAKQAIFFDAAHHENPGLLSRQRKILRNYVDDLNDLNEYMETTDWLGQTSLGKYIIKKRLNHEPQIRLKMLDYLNAMEDLIER